MSSSAPETCVFLRDKPETVKKKIMNAFTGGRTTIKEQRELGANPYICSVFDWYEKLFVQDDSELEKIENRCKSGDLICGLECKPMLLEMVQKYLVNFRKRRKEVIKNIDKYFDHEINLEGIEIEDDSV